MQPGRGAQSKGWDVLIQAAEVSAETGTHPVRHKGDGYPYARSEGVNSVKNFVCSSQRDYQ